MIHTRTKKEILTCIRLHYLMHNIFLKMPEWNIFEFHYYHCIPSWMLIFSKIKTYYVTKILAECHPHCSKNKMFILAPFFLICIYFFQQIQQIYSFLYSANYGFIWLTINAFLLFLYDTENLLAAIKCTSQI